jgi:hypothetical protein
LPTVSSRTQTAQKLITQLNADAALIDYKSPDTSILSPANAVNGNFSDTAKGWSDPVPLESANTAEPFPVHCLPEVLKNFAEAVAEHTQTPIDMSAVASLGASSACLQGKYLVQGKIGHTEPLNNYYVEIAKPGERKSAVCAIFEEPIKAYEKHKNEVFALDIAQSANIRQVLEKEMEALKNAVAKGKKTYADMEAKQAEINGHQDIKPIRLICGDVTPEALTSLLADNNGRMAMFSAEGGIFDILKGLYSQVTNIDTFLKAHCCDSIRVDRKGRPPEFIEKPCLTTLLFIQPDVLRELVGNDTFRGRGLVARFLYAYPQSTVGSRKYKTQPISSEAEHKYRKLCEDMLSDSPQEAKTITLSQEAEAISEQFYNELEPRLGKDGDLAHMADWAGKLHGAVLRLAGLIHVVNGTSKNGSASDIPFEDYFNIKGETMAAAVELGRYFLAHAQVCYGFMGMDEGMENAKYILSQLEKKNPQGELRPSDIWLLCKGKRFKKVADISPCLELLTDYGYIRPIPGIGLYEGGRPKGDRYVLNPKHFSALSQP